MNRIEDTTIEPNPLNQREIVLDFATPDFALDAGGELLCVFRKFRDSDFSKYGTVISVIPGHWKERDRGSFFGSADLAKPVFIMVMGADDAETEASETSERERPAIDFEAELRARAVGTRHFGAAVRRSPQQRVPKGVTLRSVGR
jgi:hypothetical protein